MAAPKSGGFPGHFGSFVTQIKVGHSKKLVSVGWILNSDPAPKKGHTVGPQIMEPYGFV